MRSRRPEALLLAGGLVAALLLGELLVARVRPQPTYSRVLADEPAMYAQSPRLSFELRPGFRGRHRRSEFDVAIAIDSRGFRQPEIPPEKGVARRVLVLGDSFTFGWGVEEPECWVRRTERALRARGLPRVQLVNAGYGCGEYPDTYYLCLVRRRVELDPDAVVVGFYVGNDIDGTAARTRRWPERDADGLPLRIEHGRDHVEDGHWVRRERKLHYRLPLLRDSHLFHLLRRSVKQARRSARSPAANLKHPSIYEEPYGAETERHVARVQRLFLAMRDRLREDGTPLVVVLIPAQEQVYPEAYAESGLDLDKPQRLFVRFFREAGIPALDLLPSLRGVPGLYFPEDGHFNAAGHARSAALVADFLEEVLGEALEGGAVRIGALSPPGSAAAPRRGRR